MTRYNFLTNVWGDSKEALEKAARAEAEEFFGTAQLVVDRVSVSPSEKEGSRYAGTFSYSVAELHPAFSS